MSILTSIFSDAGNREINEDYATFLQREDNILAVLADGLGGHDKGEVASEFVGNYVKENFSFDGSCSFNIRKVINEAQEKLIELQEKEHAPKAMKTTIVMAVVKKDFIRIAHVGDSRGYVFLKNGKYIRTLDHSVSQMLVLAGEIKEQDIRFHEERSKLLRVMGSEWEKDPIEIEKKINIDDVEAVLLCSDGFWELIDEKSMQNSLRKSKNPEEWLKHMVAEIQKNGKNVDMDNYSAVAIMNSKKTRWWKIW